MNESQKINQYVKSYKDIFKALVGLTGAQCISILESAKIDIILNDSHIVLDGKSGGITLKKNKFQQYKKTVEN